MLEFFNVGVETNKANSWALRFQNLCKLRFHFGKLLLESGMFFEGETNQFPFSFPFVSKKTPMDAKRETSGTGELALGNIISPLDYDVAFSIGPLCQLRHRALGDSHLLGNIAT
jgi:hypothetical protein